MLVCVCLFVHGACIVFVVGCSHFDASRLFPVGGGGGLVFFVVDGRPCVGLCLFVRVSPCLFYVVVMLVCFALYFMFVCVHMFMCLCVVVCVCEMLFVFVCVLLVACCGWLCIVVFVCGWLCVCWLIVLVLCLPLLARRSNVFVCSLLLVLVCL